MSGFTFETSREQGFNLSDGTSGEYVRVRFRMDGERQWRKFVIVPDPDQDIETLMRHGNRLVRAYLAEKGGRP